MRSIASIYTAIILVCGSFCIDLLDTFINGRVVQKFPRAILWTTIETGTAIICACLPTYRPLIPQRCTMSAKLKNWYSSIRGTSLSQGSQSNTLAPNFSNGSARCQSNDSRRGIVQTSFGSTNEGNLFRGASDSSGDELFRHSKNAITVETRIDVV